MADVVKAAVAAVVRGKDHLVVAPDAHGDDIVHVAADGIEVEDKDETRTLKGDDVVILPDKLKVGRAVAQEVDLAEGLDHVMVKKV